MVKVDDVRANSPPRFVEHLLEIVGRLHDPPRRLRRDVYPVAPAVGQGLAYGQLALSAQIHPSRVDVVDAAVDGPMDHIDGLVHVDGFAVGQHGQAQHAEAQGRYLDAGLAHRPVLHLRIVVQYVFAVFRTAFRLFFCQGRRPHDHAGGDGQGRAFEKISSVHRHFLIPPFRVSRPDFAAPAYRRHAGTRRRPAARRCRPASLPKGRACSPGPYQ